MAKFFQFVTWPAIYLLSKIFLHLKIESATDIQKLRGPLIIVANHISWYDSFLLRLVVGNNHHLLPIRFMGVKKFNHWPLQLLRKTGIVSLVYKLFGVFVVYPGAGLEKNIETPKNILRGGGIVLIYPEGSINTSPDLLPFKHGAGALAVQTKAPVLPLYFMRRDGNLLVIIGSPFIAHEDSDFSVATAIIRNHIQSLRDASLSGAPSRAHAGLTHGTPARVYGKKLE